MAPWPRILTQDSHFAEYLREGEMVRWHISVDFDPVHKIARLDKNIAYFEFLGNKGVISGLVFGN